MPRVRRIALKRRAVADPIAEALAGLTGGARVIRFVEGFLRGEKGEYAGALLHLLPFQREIIGGLYDPIDDTGARLIRAGLVFLPRKNGKTSIAAAIAVYETFEGGAGAQVVIAANSRDQASLLFDVAASMVEQCPELAARAVISRAKKRITDKRTRSTLRVISADASTAHGLDCTCWIYDELHEAPNRELYDALATSGGARRNSLGLCISTAGHEKQSVLGELYDHAKAAAVDPSLDPGFYSYIAEADSEADWSDETTWRQANPALGAFRNLDEIRQLAARAKQVPSQVDAFKRLYLNQWTQAETTWLDLGAWRECGAVLPEEALQECEAFGGLDLSSTLDLTAFALVVPHEGRVSVRHWAWLPAEGIRERELRDRVPYRRWAEEGRIELIPGGIVDKRIVIERIKELARTWRIRAIGFDRWGADMVQAELEKAGLEVIEMGQGFGSMSAPTKELESFVVSRTLAHGACPLLAWQAACCSIKSDPAGNIKPVKPDRMKSTKRIDSIVASIMATGVLMRLGVKRRLEDILANPIEL